MNMYLAGTKCGWITEPPAGNRLRWSYPIDEQVGDNAFQGLPKRIVLQRAPVETNILHSVKCTELSPSQLVPESWWEVHGDGGAVQLEGTFPRKYTLDKPVQAVGFRFSLPGITRIQVYSTANILLADKHLNTNEPFHLEAADIHRVEVHSFGGELTEFKTLDLFADHEELEWENIAVIDVASSFPAAFEDVSKRYEVPTTMTSAEWEELSELVAEASVSTPQSIAEEDPSPWTLFNIAMGTRWEYAMICGFGFFDGPRTQVSSLDTIKLNTLLGEPEASSTLGFAYRVFEEIDRGVGPSNIVVLPLGVAPPLNMVSMPSYIDPRVSLTAEDKFEAKLEMDWLQSDPSAIGVEIEERIGSSLVISSPEHTHRFQNRTSPAANPDVPHEDPSLYGRVARVFQVLFYDVTLQARARAVDGWDRVSEFSEWTEPTNLKLVHYPPAPPLASVSYHDGEVRIVRQVDSPDVPNWEPDRLVEHAPGVVQIYRQIANPRTEDVVIGSPDQVERSLYKANIPGVVDASDFLNGYLTIGKVKAKITEVENDTFYFLAPSPGLAFVNLFNQGQGRLQQSHQHLDLWLHVADFPVSDIPQELVFNDPLPALGDELEFLSYEARVFFLGEIGPPSNIVQTVRIPATPIDPPPFTVSTLGLDFYNRTLLEIRFTDTVDLDTEYTIWWADGKLGESDFAQHAVPGEIRLQKAHDRRQLAHEARYLYDVIACPIPVTKDRVITIGIQAINPAGGQSNFTVESYTLSAG